MLKLASNKTRTVDKTSEGFILLPEGEDVG